MSNKEQVKANIVSIKVPNMAQFYFRWLDLIKPLHNLNPMEMKVAAVMLFKRSELKKVIFDDVLLNEMLFSPSIRKEARDLINMNQAQFNQNMSKLRKLGVFNDSGFSPRYVPAIEPDSENYKLVFNFTVESNVKNTGGSNSKAS